MLVWLLSCEHPPNKKTHSKDKVLVHAQICFGLGYMVCGLKVYVTLQALDLSCEGLSLMSTC